MARDMIVFGEDWGGLPSSTQCLIKNLAADRKILWVNSIGLRQPSFSAVDIKRTLNKVGRFVVSGLNNVQSKKGVKDRYFRVLNPITLPAPKSKLTRKLSAKLLSLQIRPQMREMNLDHPIFWSSLPTVSDLTYYLGDLPVIYYCGDDFAALDGVDHKVVSEHERDLVKVSDLIVTVSDCLLNKFPKHKTKLLTHGVNIDLFSRAAAAAPDLPNNGLPCAGFYGSLCEWLDQNLLVQVIQSHPNWNFIFIGEEKVDLRQLKKYSNTKFLGPRPHSELASYSQHWDVSLLPFRLNDQIIACNPLKLKEYLATGKPVISTNFPAVKKFSDCIDIAEDAEQFGQFLNKYPESNLSMRRRRRDSVASEDWSRKANILNQWVEAL